LPSQMGSKRAMSANGTKRTSHSNQLMSAFGGKADIDRMRRDVRFWPKADMPLLKMLPCKLSPEPISPSLALHWWPYAYGHRTPRPCRGNLVFRLPRSDCPTACTEKPVTNRRCDLNKISMFLIPQSIAGQKHRSVTDITEWRTGFSDCVHTGGS